jgi:CheY-like chemotaxis protein
MVARMTEPATTTPASKTILIVDDEPAVREVLIGYFEHQYGPRGYTVETASDGAEALTAVRRRRPALILLDIEMPGMDGVQALRRRGDPPWHSLVPAEAGEVPVPRPPGGDGARPGRLTCARDRPAQPRMRTR